MAPWQLLVATLRLLKYGSGDRPRSLTRTGDDSGWERTPSIPIHVDEQVNERLGAPGARSSCAHTIVKHIVKPAEL